MPTILSLCDYSGRWSQPYREAGYDVIQVDLKHGHDVRLFPSDPSDEPRLPRQFEDIRQLGIHGILAAPPCTVFAGSGARWPRDDAAILEGLALVDACVRIAWAAKPKWWVLENPTGKLPRWMGPSQFSFHPNDFGGWNPKPDHYDRSTKRTCLWGEFTAPEPKPIPSAGCNWGWKNLGGKSERTKELRSHTPLGFAYAFAAANP